MFIISTTKRKKSLKLVLNGLQFMLTFDVTCVSDDMLQIPSEVSAALEPIKDNDEAVKAYGIHLGTEMCKKILANGIKTLHLYTLNMEKSALAILMVIYLFTSILS